MISRRRQKTIDHSVHITVVNYLKLPLIIRAFWGLGSSFSSVELLASFRSFINLWYTNEVAIGPEGAIKMMISDTDKVAEPIIFLEWLLSYSLFSSS